MKNIIGNLRSECIRLFSKSTFIICIVLYILAIIAILITEPFSDGLKYSCDGMLTYIVGLSNFQRVLVLLASLPMATSFCDDIADKYMDLIILRSSTHTYIVSKIIICFLSSFAVSFIGMMIYSVYCSITNGVGIQLFNIKEGTVYYDCANSSLPFLVIIIKVFFFSMVSAVYAVWGMTFSSYVKGRFAAMVSTIFVNTIFEVVGRCIPKALRLYSIQIGNSAYGLGTAGTIVMSVMVCLGYILIASLLFAYNVRRRVQNEVI